MRAGALPVERACCTLSNDDSWPSWAHPQFIEMSAHGPFPFRHCISRSCVFIRRPGERNGTSVPRLQRGRARTTHLKTRISGKDRPVQPPLKESCRRVVLFQLRSQLGVPGEWWVAAFYALPSFKSSSSLAFEKCIAFLSWHTGNYFWSLLLNWCAKLSRLRDKTGAMHF